jgi:hypothetical protein
MTEELVAMQVECEPLEETPDVEEPVAAPPQHVSVTFWTDLCHQCCLPHVLRMEGQWRPIE